MALDVIWTVDIVTVYLTTTILTFRFYSRKAMISDSIVYFHLKTKTSEVVVIEKRFVLSEVLSGFLLTFAALPFWVHVAFYKFILHFAPHVIVSRFRVRVRIRILFLYRSSTSPPIKWIDKVTIWSWRKMSQHCSCSGWSTPGRQKTVFHQMENGRSHGL